MVMKKTSKSAFVPIVLSCASLLVQSAGALGATLPVPSQDYPTIQAAMNAASPGDTVLVGPGTYYETVMLSAGVVLAGSGRDVTIIDGGGAELPVVTLENDPSGTAAVRDLTLQNGAVGLRAVNSAIEISQNLIWQNLYGGIAVWGGACTISGNRIQDNGGPGLRTDGGDGTIKDNEFTGNHAVPGRYFPFGPIAGGAECNLSGNMQILRNSFTANSGVGGGGIAVDRLQVGASCLIEGNVVEANSGNAGGIYAGEWDSADPTRMVVRDNTVRNNQGGQAGGVLAQGFVEVTGNEIKDNVGSGVWYHGYDVGHAVIRENTITGNTDEPVRGAGLVLQSTLGTAASNNVIENNSPRGMFLDYVGGEIQRNTVSGHSELGIHVTRNAGRALRFEGNTIRGNGAGFLLVSGVFTLESNLIENNWSPGAGAALRCEGDEITLVGNVVRGNRVLSEEFRPIVYVPGTSRFLIESNVISDNDGIGVVPAGTGGGSVRHNRIERNTQGGIGSWQGVESLTGNLIRDNGGLGVGVSITRDGVLIANNVVVGNQNGISLHINATPAGVLNNTVVGNQATGLYIIGWAQPSSPVRIHNNILWGNGLDLDLYPWWAWWEPSSVDLLAQWSHNLFVTGGDFVAQSTLSTDPLLANWQSGDFHLQPGSPCIDAGRTDVLPADLTSDFYGAARVSNGTVDIGATEFPMPSLNFSVRTASAKFFHNRDGRVALWADLDMPMPPPTDVLSLDFDGVRLFSVPFSVFRPGVLPDVYVHADKGLIVRLDFGTRRLFVHTPKMLLPDVDNSDGVDVRFQTGSAVGQENIVMRELLHGKRWVYVRPGLLDTPPDAD